MRYYTIKLREGREGVTEVKEEIYRIAARL